MRKLLFIILFLLVSCDSMPGRNTKATIEWVNEAEKPIRVIKANASFINNNRYTLISADGIIFDTGEVRLSLPTTLK